MIGGFFVLNTTVAQAAGATIEVSAPQKITNTGDTNGAGYYERDSSLLKASDGTWYLIYSKSQTVFTSGGSPDDLKYDIFVKTSTDDGINWSEETKILNAASIDATSNFRNATIVEAGGKIWVIGADIINHEGDIYAATYSDGSWSSQTMIFDGTWDTGAFHLDAIADGNDIRLFYGIQNESNGIGFIKYNSETDAWDTSVTLTGVSGQIPRVTKVGDTYHLVSTDWENIRYSKTTTPDTTWPASTVIFAAPSGVWANDPTILNYDTNGLIVFHSPSYDSDSSQPVEYVYSTDSGSTWSSSVPFTKAISGTNASWDMMPHAYLKDASTIMLYAGMEQRGVNRGQSDIVKIEFPVASIGNSHFTTIQDAINTASSGDTINVAAGTYNESLSLEKAINLTGADKLTTIIQPSADEGAVITIDAVTDAMTITGFTLDANNIVNKSGIYIQNSSANITVEQNNVINFTDKGILISNSSNNTIKNNTIDDSSTGSKAGIYIDAFGGNDSTGNIIGGTEAGNGNTISLEADGEGVAGNRYGVLISGFVTGNNTIQNNTINGGTRAAQQDSSVSGTTTFSDNTIGNITSPSYAGIEIDGGSANITKNTLTNAVRPIEIQGATNITVTGNTINGATYSGINLGNYSGVADVSGNTIHGITDNNGIWAQTSGTGLTIAKNTLYDISGSGAPSYPGRGIQIDTAAKNANIDGNEIHDVTGFSGIVIDTGATGAKINNNFVHNNEQGVVVNEQTEEFKNNRILNNRWGVDLNKTGATFVLINNSIADNNTSTAIPSDSYNLGLLAGIAQADKNWWGSAVPDFATIISGSVTYDPWFVNSGMTILSNAVTGDTVTAPSGDDDLVLSLGDAGEVDLPDGVTDVVLDDDSSLDLSDGLVDNAVTLQSGIPDKPIVLTSSDLDNVSASIPDGTLITGPVGWDGIIEPPVSGTPSGIAPTGFSVGGTVISIGSPDGTLVFDNPVTILLKGVTGTVGYRPSGSTVWQTITNTCGGTYDTPDAPVAPGECSRSNGTNTKIVTFHFTSFGSLTATPAPVSSGGGGGGIIGPSNAYANWLAQNAQVATPTSSPTNGTEGQVLGEQIFADGALIRATNGFDVYIVKYTGNKKFKRLILNPSVFNSYEHLKWADVLNVEQSVIDSFVTSDLVRVVGDTKVYKLTPAGDKGNKQWVKSENAFNSRGFDWDAIYEINTVDRNSYVTGANIE